MQRKTYKVYGIDMAPADPSTMMTAMVKAQKISTELGQEYVVFTADQQLYRVALHVQWENPVLLGNIYLILGGMHMLVSYCGCVGTLMTDTGIVDVLNATMNIRALRMLCEELLRPIFVNSEVERMDDIFQVLDNLASQSRTTQL